ncbi:MAG: class I SAM-dependent rRNA methyltransferase [Clostridia bacterium]|nr:class I SAM-dependent rRNA methyltransferase [Clostridia bacterium]
MARAFIKLTVTEKAERSIRAGHPWVYAEEVASAPGEAPDGSLVDVYSRKDRYLGTGFFNSASLIRVRLLSENANDRFDDEFFRRRIRWCIDYRRTVMGEDWSCCRVIFGEADRFPGLTVDRFEDVLVTQVLSLGFEKMKERLYDALITVFSEYGVHIRAICERNDVAIRLKEGMEEGKGFYNDPRLDPDFDGKLIITENGIKYEIDVLNGQKTGYFLDQKYNRRAAARLAPGRRVLDCFTHTGAFALNCALAGAEHVTAADISKDAIEQTKHNAELNGLAERMDFVTADVFDLLTEMELAKKCPYDYIILDPPAFTKSRGTVQSAIKGYTAINAKAMKLLPRGGYLATCSCSHFMTNELFRRMLSEAAESAGVRLRQIEERQQAPDHPILWGVPETDYLKFYLFQVV